LTLFSNYLKIQIKNFNKKINMIQNTRNSYGSIAKILHWAMTSLLIVMFICAYSMMAMAPSEQKWTLYDLHKSTGLLLFSLAFLRLIWRWINSTPNPSPFDS